MIYFDSNALISLPLWAQDDHPVIRKMVDGEPAAVCSVVWYEFLIGPIKTAEIDLATVRRLPPMHVFWINTATEPGRSNRVFIFE